MGVTLRPMGRVAAAADAGKVAIHRLPKDLARVETLFIRRHDGYVSSALAAFLEMARKVYRAQTPKQKSGDAEAS